MTKTIEIIPNQPDQLTIDPSYFAYKDGQMFTVWQTEKNYCAGGCFGKIRFVFGENEEVLSESYPLMNFNNGYELISSEMIDRYKKIVDAYNHL